MPQRKLYSSNQQADVRCNVNYRTQGIGSACDQYSLSKMVQKRTKNSQEQDLSINTELVTEAIKAAVRKSINGKKMTTVMERSEDDAPDNGFENEMITENVTDRESDFELEPVRFDLYSVRRRSRQFYPVTKEKSGKETEDQLNAPVFNLGRSLKSLYCKDRYAEQSESDVEDNVDMDQPVNYDSDSGVSKVTPYKPLKKVQSLPEINAGGYSWEGDSIDLGQGQIGHANSFTDLSRTWKQQNKEMQKGPGYAFLASVADNMRGKQAKTVSLRADMSVAKTKNATVAESGRSVKAEENVKKEEPVPDPVQVVKEQVVDKKPKQSIFKSVYDWGTQTQNKVTNKELNMYSPMSF